MGNVPLLDESGHRMTDENGKPLMCTQVTGDEPEPTAKTDRGRRAPKVLRRTPTNAGKRGAKNARLG